jgi:type III secretion protein O
MAMIDELLFIKKFREKKAEKEFQKARLALVEARKVEEAANQTLTDFQVQAEQDELSWYKDLCSRVVKPRDIANVQEDVAMLRATEQMHANALHKAEREHTLAQDTHAQANGALREASKAREKFTELARNYHWIVAQEAERKEELELEEVSGNIRKKDDWGTETDD